MCKRRRGVWAGVLLVLAATVWLCGSARATVISKVEPNDTIPTAQNVDPYFSLDFSPDIGDTVSNTSLTIPHVTIEAIGDGSPDYYSFTVSQPNSFVILDIDYGCLDVADPGNVDTYIELYLSDGTWLASDDDSNPNWGAGGSGPSWGNLDSYMEAYLDPGQYVVLVSDLWYYPDVLEGETYSLQISVEGHATGGGAAIPEPCALTLLALGGLGLLARRRR